MRKSQLFSSLLAIGVLACGSSQTTSQPATGPNTAQHAPGEGCPAELAGARFAATDTTDGVSIDVTTSGDVATLRAHVHKMADMHSAMADAASGSGADPHGGMGSGDPHGDMGSGHMHGEMPMPAVRATYAEIPDGARIVLVPVDPAQVAALRTKVREHTAMMSKGECPMAGGPGSEHAPHAP